LRLRYVNHFWKTAVIIFILIMTFSAATISLITQTAIEKEKATLLSNAQILSQLITQISEFDNLYIKESELGYSARNATLTQVRNAFKNFTLTEDQFEYLLGEVNQNHIQFIAYSYQPPPNVHLNDLDTAIPMRLALQGETGVIASSDYLGRETLAAHIAIPETKWGLVVKQDLQQFTLPFYQTGVMIFALTLVLSIIIFYLALKRERSYQVEMKQKEKRFQQLVESAHDWIWETNSEGVYTYVSPQAKKLIGYKVHDVIGKTPFDFMPKEEATRVRAIFEKIVKKRQDIINLENTNLHKNGQEVILMTSGTPYFDEHNQLLGYRGMDKDITRMKKHEEEITHIAFFDSLTGLANRDQIMQRIEEELFFCKRTNSISALLYLDLDGFKDINDSIGHDIGDQVLIEITRRIKNALRPYDIAGRIGGDEFVVLLRCSDNDIKHVSPLLEQLLERILFEINQPIQIEANTLNVGVSIGVALIPMDGETTSELLRHADTAMYQAKNTGKNQYCFYHEGLQIEADEKLNIKQDLTRAFENNEFELYYQRQTDITGKQTVGLEALIRWQHPINGFIAPNKFLRYIDEFNMTAQLDEWVMHQACLDIKNHFAPFIQNFSVSINLTPETFNKNDLIQRLSQHAERYDVEPYQLTLEITEGSLIQDVENAHDIITALSMLGYKIALDDFGTGYSSLSYLSKIEFNTIKIDRSFIQNLETSPVDQNICQLIIGLAQDLKKHIVAEGVETQQQIEFLDKQGVSIVQGFIYSKPQPVSIVCEHLQLEQQNRYEINE